MNKVKASNYTLILFISIINIFYADFFGFNYLIDNFKTSSWVLFLIVILINIIICIFFKGFNNKFSPFKETKRNYFIKILTIIYCTISIIVITLFSSLLIKSFFYKNTPIYIFILVTLIASIILSLQNFTAIISSATLFLTFFILFYISPLLHLPDHDYTLLFPLNFNFKEVYKILLMLLFFLDNFILCYYSPFFNKGIKKKHLLIGNTILGLYILYTIVDSISLLGANYFQGTFMTAFFRWKLFKGTSLFENYDIFLLTIVSITTIYKLSIYFNLIRILLSKKKSVKFKILITLIFTTISIFLSLYIMEIKNYLQYIFLLLLFLIIIISGYFIIKSWDDKYAKEHNT